MAALTGLQTEILKRFFDHRKDFFVTGGAALVGFHLRHRTTNDLDLFTPADVLDDSERTLSEVAIEIGATTRALRRAPAFRRWIVERSDESVIVDLVRDETPQVFEKLEVGGIVVDPPAEILANKLCTLLSRVEPRDLLDVKMLEEAGFDAIAALPAAETKDGGLSAAQLAWVLSTYRIAASAELYGVPREELERYRDSLIERLSRAAFPRS